jgi:hypothetical protein
MWVAERFEQNAIDDPEDHGVGANADNQRDQCDGAEEGRAQ